MRLSINKIILLFGVLMTVGCAQQTPITGGIKDIIPPKIKASSPTNFSTRYAGSKIAMEFDEYIEVKDLQSELIVSPPLKYPLTHKIKGKRVIFTIKDTLLPNTTYNFNFGASIVDFTEGNPLDSNLFVFSTGSSLDSGFVKGAVKNAFDLSPVEGAYIYLFKSTDDSAFYKGSPDYVGRTKANGKFTIPYISDGDYSVLAIQDENKSFSYDLPAEQIAFEGNRVRSDEEEPLDLSMFQEDNKEQYVKRVKQKNEKAIEVVFNASIKGALEIEGLNSNLNAIREWDEDTDSLILWLREIPTTDTLDITLKSGEEVDDTVRIEWQSKEDFLGKKRFKKLSEEGEFISVSPVLKSGTLDYFDTLKLLFDAPIRSCDFSKVLLVEDQDTLGFDSLRSFVETSFDKGEDVRQLPVLYNWKKGANYKLVLFPGAFKTLHGLTTDTMDVTFRTLNFEDYGNLQFKVNAPEQSYKYVLQLLDKDKKVLKDYQINSTDKISLPLIRPGEYGFKLIYDRNSNKKWDTGDLNDKRQPEKIIFYQEPVSVRANWDIELEWNIKE